MQSTDSGNPSKTGVAIFTVNVIDLNEQPKFVTPYATAISLAENCPRGTWLAYYPVVGAHRPRPCFPALMASSCRMAIGCALLKLWFGYCVCDLYRWTRTLRT